jgi:manganese transport protein
MLCEIAICACDLAEVIGSAIALNLLFHIPLLWGVCITALDVLAVMYLQNKGFRWIEALVITLIVTIGACFLAGDHLLATEPGGRPVRIPAASGDPPEHADAVRGDRHSRRHRDAAQPLPPLVDRADTQVRADRTKESAKRSSSPPSTRPPLSCVRSSSMPRSSS